MFLNKFLMFIDNCTVSDCREKNGGNIVPRFFFFFMKKVAFSMPQLFDSQIRDKTKLHDITGKTAKNPTHSKTKATFECKLTHPGVTMLISPAAAPARSPSVSEGVSVVTVIP